MAAIRCTACSYAIPPDAFIGRDTAPCPLCGRTMQAFVMPAIAGVTRAAAPPALPESPPQPGETVCFYNPERRATTSCSHCGVFISEAWAAQWGQETVCFKCLGDLRSTRQDARFQSRRVLWDNLALGTACLPLICAALSLLIGPLSLPFISLSVMLSLVTAPTALGLAIFAWNKPRSLVPRGRGRIVWSILVALIQCAGWVALSVGLVSDKIQ